MKRRTAGDAATIGDRITGHKTRSVATRFQPQGYVQVWKTDLAGRQSLVAEGPNDVTTGGIDWIIDQLYVNSARGDRGANYLALSNNSTDTTTSDTTFTGEINDSGLNRVDVAAAGGISHATGTNTVVLSHVFTATTAVANIHKAALFESNGATRPIHNFTFASDTSLAANERLTVSWTVTIA